MMGMTSSDMSYIMNFSDELCRATQTELLAPTELLGRPGGSDDKLARAIL